MTDVWDRLAQINDIITGGSTFDFDTFDVGDSQIEGPDPQFGSSSDFGDAELPQGGGVYEQASKATGGAMPGAVALQNYIVATFGGSSGGIYNNRSVRGRPDILSVHAEGRAGDVMVDAATGDRIADWLVANADRLGIQQVIWNGRDWNSKTRQWTPYGGVNPHTDHVHWELTRQAAAGTTRGGALSTARVKTGAGGDTIEDRLAFIDAIIRGRPIPRQVSSPTQAGPAPGVKTPSEGLRGSFQQYAQSRLRAFGWTEDEWAALDQLVMKESGWNPTAQNPKSTAYGIGQFLDSTWQGVGFRKTSDPYVQIDAMLAYIARRYGSPSAALAHHRRENWY